MCMRIMHDSVGDVELLQSDRGGERGMKGGMWRARSSIVDALIVRVVGFVYVGSKER